MATFSMFKNSKRRAVEQILEATGQSQVTEDGDFSGKRDRFTKMAKDINELGAGIFQTLSDTKKCFQTSYELSLVLDKFYNGEFAEDWPEVDASSTMRQGSIVTNYKEAWHQAQTKTRPSAAATAVERALSQVRHFVNTSVPEIKERISERNAAKLDFESYSRRLDALLKSDPAGTKVPALRQKLEIAEARYNALNTALKDSLVKEKIARDTLIEECTTILLVCQHEMLKQVTADIGDLVSALPQGKVQSVRKKIQDTIASGGPVVVKAEDSTGLKVAKMAVGIKTTLTQEEQNALYAAEQDRLAKATMLAQTEQKALASSSKTIPASNNPLAGSPGFAGNAMPFQTPVSIRAPLPTPQPRVLECCVALYDCEAESVGDLTFGAGEVIEVTSKDPSGWWQGRVKGEPSRKGQFPANYVGPA